MLNMAMLYFLRVNLSVAIICMVKEPTVVNGNHSMSPANATMSYKIDTEGASTGNVCERFFCNSTWIVSIICIIKVILLCN